MKVNNNTYIIIFRHILKIHTFIYTNFLDNNRHLKISSYISFVSVSVRYNFEQ